MKKKVLSCILAAMLCIPVFAGCGGTGDASDVQENIQTEGTGTETTDKTTASNNGTVHLKFWCDETEMPLLDRKSVV